MDERFNDVVLEFVAATDSLDGEAGVELLTHVDDYDVPEAYSRRVTNVEDLDADLVEAGQVMFADHVPEDFDATTEDPNLFYATYEDGRVEVHVKARYDALDDFTDALDHVLAEADLTVGHFRVVLDVGVDVTTDTDITDAGPPADYRLDVKTHPTQDRSAISLQYDPADPLVLSGSTDPVRERVDEAVEFVTGHLP